MLPIYKITVDEENLGLTAVSFVDDPAIDVDFVYFSKEKSLFQFNDEKREVVSPILIPDQLIYRVAEDGTPYYIKWTREVIEQCAKRYLSNQYNNNVTIMHPQFYDETLSYEDVLEDDVFLVRMWIIDDVETDIANTEYGFNKLPQGTLMVHYKVLNEELWQRIKSGELKGLSIEATARLEKVNFNKIQNKHMTLFERITEFLNSISDEVKELETVVSKDNTDSAQVEIKYIVDDESFITVDSEGIARNGVTMEALQQGEYMLADGNIFVVDENSRFVETKPQEEATVEEKLEAPIAEKKEEEMPIAQDEEKKEEEPTEDKPTEDVEKIDESKEVEINEGKVEEDVREIETIEVKINESAFNVEKEIANHINNLISEISSKEDEIKLLQSRIAELEKSTPTSEPLKPMINQSNNDVDYSDIVNKLNRYKH